jgi:hypothetical protein
MSLKVPFVRLMAAQEAYKVPLLDTKAPLYALPNPAALCEN